jgi:hypothetical protein
MIHGKSTLALRETKGWSTLSPLNPEGAFPFTSKPKAMSTDSFEEAWDKMGDLTTPEELEKGVRDNPNTVRRINQQSMIEAMQRERRQFNPGLPKKPHHKYPSNYTPPKKRLRKKK